MLIVEERLTAWISRSYARAKNRPSLAMVVKLSTYVCVGFVLYNYLFLFWKKEKEDGRECDVKRKNKRMHGGETALNALSRLNYRAC